MTIRKNLPVATGGRSITSSANPRRDVVRAGGGLVRVPALAHAQVDVEEDVVRIRNVEYVPRPLDVATEESLDIPHDGGAGPMPFETVEADEVYFVRSAKPRADGPWLGEADKVAWRDSATGYDCIVLRHATDGTLGGYVGLPLGHPLWGFEAGAIPSGLGVDVHGGITYGRICQERRPTSGPRARLAAEARRICHVPNRDHERREPVGADDRHAWWFGFRCDRVHDVIPAPREPHRRRAMEAEVGAVYRDDAYVIEETRDLARQLFAVAEEREVEARLRPSPPAALDPRRER